MHPAEGHNPTGTPPAGWYPDPAGTPAQRYWDGAAWSAGPPASTAPAPRRDSNRRGWVIAAVCAMVLVLLVVLWAMRPSRQGQPGQPGQPAHSDGAAAPSLVVEQPATARSVSL
ncbi:MAG: DUF2510 domain-containing protein [Mycobacterium sp.]|nr:DUF2510 domain-containing protein [Mycobacterium sp.]